MYISMFKVTIRELLLFVLVLCVALGWWVDRRLLHQYNIQLTEAVYGVAGRWADDVGHEVVIPLPGGKKATVSPIIP